MAPPVATSIAPNSSTSLAAVAGADVTEFPSVIVKDQRGVTIPGVPVTFTVTSGGGTITGSSVTTNASGVATVGGWTLGTVAGSNSLTASISGLTPVTFTATGTAGGPGGGAITSVLLPSLGGAVSFARAINDGGVVVGGSRDNTGTVFAVRWTPMSSGSWSIASIGGRDSYAVAINARGDAVGRGGVSGKLWPAAGGEIDLGPGEPTGINAAETIVGRLWLGSSLLYRAVVWKKPSGGWLPLPAVNPSQDLPALAGTGSVAQAITDLGVIGGAIGSSACVAVRWEPSGDQWTQPIAYPGTDAFYCTIGHAINGANDIAGYMSRGGGAPFPMFLQSSGAVTILGSVGATSGFAYGVNDAQRVVGDHRTQDDRRAFVWWPGLTAVQELGAPSGYAGEEAGGINNRTPAQAVGTGRATDRDVLRAIVWTLH